MQFSYIAVDSKGVRQKGLIDASTQKEVLEYLRTGKLTPISIKESTSVSQNVMMLNKVKTGDIVIFTRQLSSMITTGLTLIEALTILKEQTNKPHMQRIISDLIASLSEGSSFSLSLSKHPEAFSDVYIALIRAAETGGLLDRVLERLADTMEKSEDIKKHVRSALFYPMIIVVGVIGVIAVMNIFVVPQLGSLYESMNLELPLSTQIVLMMSNIFRTFFPVIILGIIGLFFLYGKLLRTDNGRLTVDRIKLKLPVFGSIIMLSSLDEIARTLSLLISSGTSIIEALNITSQVAGNVIYRKAVKDSAGLVEKGIPLSKAFENQNVFPLVFVQMLRVGETTGKIDESLMRVAQYFERDLNLKIKTLTSSIEPILIIVLGIAVAFLIISIITPIYSLISQIQ